jgi:hypothetical protein
MLISTEGNYEMTDHLTFINSQKTLMLPNLETSTRCTLHCPQCTRAKLHEPKNSSKYKEIKTRINAGFDLPLKDAEKLLTFFDRGVMLCGQLSDPVLWLHLFDFLKFSKNYPDKNIIIMTAASQRNIEWYKQAFELSHKNVSWTFGLDGMQDTSMIYRVGQNSELLFDAMILGKSMGVKICWSYIVFKHNEHQIDQAKKFADQHDINLFFTKSDRRGGGIDVPINWLPKKNKEILKHEN